MKKRYLILLLVLLVSLLGCSFKDNGKNINNKPNQSVGYIKFYVPEDFEYRSDLRGEIYSETTRKVFVSSDDNITIDVYVNRYDGDTIKYVDAVNNMLSDGDILFKEIEQENLSETEDIIYGREGFTLTVDEQEKYNYTYVTTLDNYLHIVSISGSKNKEEEINKLSKDVLESLSR